MAECDRNYAEGYLVRPVFGRRHSEVALVLPAELGRAVVADEIAGLTDALALPEIPLGPIQLGLLGVLQRGQVHNLSELLVKARAAHIDQGGQLVNRDLLGQIPVHMLDRACDLLDLAALLQAITEGLRFEVTPYNIRTTVISPGAVDTELPNHITEEGVAEAMQGFYREYAIPADSFARAVVYTMSQPEEVDVNEILFRPTRQEV